MEINQKFLQEEIETLEKWYVKSLIELIKLPIFLEQINKEIETTEDENKIEELKNMISNNEKMSKWHNESLENVEKILKEVYKLKK
jgi:UDP-galactopyranose mutase